MMEDTVMSDEMSISKLAGSAKSNAIDFINKFKYNHQQAAAASNNIQIGNYLANYSQLVAGNSSSTAASYMDK